jgi:hypothetical protein
MPGQPNILGEAAEEDGRHSKLKSKRMSHSTIVYNKSKQACCKARAAAFPPAYKSGAGDELSSSIMSPCPSTIMYTI